MPSTKSRTGQDCASASAEGPRKRVKLLLEDDSSSGGESSEVSGSVAITHPVDKYENTNFKVNKEYAQRFEHNQRRAELHRLEEKYGKASIGGRTGLDDEGPETSSSEEEEDDEGILASGVLDDQFMETLEAIRTKDPRVYDEKARFYSKVSDDDDEDDEEEEEKRVDVGLPIPTKKKKPMYLRDYHRQTLLQGDVTWDEDHNAPGTYAQQQDELKRSIVEQMHAAADRLDSEVSDTHEGHESGAGFLVKTQFAKNITRQSKLKPELASVSIEAADNDPETYLSNFLAAKAWVSSKGVGFQPFESDDEEDERRAEAFEQAYNLRFEHQQPSNEKLLSHARDAAAKYSVRKESTNSRKRTRDAEHAERDMAKTEHDQEKARFRRLKIEEAEDKVRRIKEAAGLSEKALEIEQWSEFLTGDWDDVQWEAEMKQRFGDLYYADQDYGSSDFEAAKSKQKIKKPKWKDDIDIKDLVPNFQKEEAGKKFSISDGSDNDASVTQARKASKTYHESQKRESRKERRRIEQLVDERLAIDLALDMPHGKSTQGGRFRYRETSPLAYGLTAHDILMASDSQLNQYAGLKKMAAFRDPAKKKRDKKHLGKKARLRQWRKDTFGSEMGPVKTLQEVLANEMGERQRGVGVTTKAVDDAAKANKKKRSKRSKVEEPID